jgi:sugar lactone lactonase YvrE
MKVTSIVSLLAVIALCTALQLNAQPGFIQKNISVSYQKPTDICAADLNNDGHADIITVGGGDGGNIAWWENDGNNIFSEHTLYTGFTGARGVRAADMDEDGNIDIVAAAWEANTILYLRNDGNAEFTSYTVDDMFIGAHTIDLHDVDMDGELDILCSGFDFHGHEGEIAWWKNDGIGPSSWTKHLISDRFQQSPFIHAADINGDNIPDVVACGELNGEVLWWENDGTGEFISENMIDDDFPFAHTVIARDVDQDGDNDVLGAACMSSKLAWYENDNGSFSKHPLPGYSGAIWLDAADVDNDGDMDLFGAGMGSSTLNWWKNDGNQNFAKKNLGDDFASGFAINAIYLDDDNDLDFIAIGNNSNKISWFDNTTEGIHYNHPECCVYDYEKSCWYISNTGGVSDPGYLICVDAEGEITILPEEIEDPLGMCLAEGVLYISDGDNAILGYDTDTWEQVLNIAFTPNGNFDGMAYNGNGKLYVVDTGGAIYEITLETGAVWVLVDSGLSAATQDIVYDATKDCLYAVGWCPGAPVQEISCSDGSITDHSTPFGYYDGITKDQAGNLYLASHQSGGRIIKYAAGFNNQFDLISTGHNEPAGLFYNTQNNVLAVPNYRGNTVDFINLSPTGIKKSDEPIGMIAFPNPVNGTFRINSIKCALAAMGIRITDMYGKEIMHIENYVFGDAIHVENIPAGVYFVVPVGKSTREEALKIVLR